MTRRPRTTGWGTRRPISGRPFASMLAAMHEESPLVEPLMATEAAAAEQCEATATHMAAAIDRETGLRASAQRSAGWLGLECVNARTAIWMMRALVVSNVLSRREGVVLFVPVNPIRDPQGTTVVDAVRKVVGLAAARGLG